MNPVVQADRTGCGIASVAAIAGVTYARSKAVAASLGISAQDPALWSDTTYVRRLLAQFGFSVGRSSKPFQSWSAVPDCALLAIKWHTEGGRPFWHWVVFVREQANRYVLDSKAALKTHRRIDFGRMHPKWFLPVTRRVRTHRLDFAMRSSG